MRVHPMRVRVIGEVLDELGQEVPLDLGRPCTLTATPAGTPPAAFWGMPPGGAGRQRARAAK
jgi:hypothetical protein